MDPNSDETGLVQPEESSSAGEGEVPVPGTPATLTITRTAGTITVSGDPALADLVARPEKKKERDAWDKIAALGGPLVALTVGVGAFAVNRNISNTSLAATRNTEISKLAAQLLDSGEKTRSAIIAMSGYGEAAVPVLLHLLEEALDEKAAKQRPAASAAAEAAPGVLPASGTGGDPSAAPAAAAVKTAAVASTRLAPTDTTAAIQRALEFIGPPAAPALRTALERQIRLLPVNHAPRARLDYIEFLAARLYDLGGEDGDRYELTRILNTYLERAGAFRASESDLAQTNTLVVQMLARRKFPWSQAKPLAGLNFTGTLENVRFTDARLLDAKFISTIFVDCNFERADLSGANLQQAAFGGVTDDMARVLAMIRSLDKAIVHAAATFPPGLDELRARLRDASLDTKAQLDLVRAFVVAQYQ